MPRLTCSTAYNVTSSTSTARSPRVRASASARAATSSSRILIVRGGLVSDERPPRDPSSAAALDLSLQDESDDKRVERQRLHQREAEDERREQPIGGVRVAPDTLHGGRRSAPLSEPNPEGRQAHADTRAERDQAAGGPCGFATLGRQRRASDQAEREDREKRENCSHAFSPCAVGFAARLLFSLASPYAAPPVGVLEASVVVRDRQRDVHRAENRKDKRLQYTHERAENIERNRDHQLGEIGEDPEHEMVGKHISE